MVSETSPESLSETSGIANVMMFIQASYALLDFELLLFFIAIPMLKATKGHQKTIKFNPALCNLDASPQIN